MSHFINQEQKDKVKRRLVFDENEPIENIASISNSTNNNSRNADSYENPQINNDGNILEPSKIVAGCPENRIKPIPNEVNITDLSNITHQQKYEQMLKWNFDFENEVPLNGDWEWERVEPPRSIDHKEKVWALGKEELESDRNI